MLRKWLLVAALSLLSGSAFAACTNPLSIKDGSGSSISMSMSSNADGFCQYNFNLAQINGVVPLMGNGVTGTGSLRVTIASDNTAFPVNATLAAETTKVIGTVRIASGGVASGSYAAGSYASGALAAGAFASGAGVDGWDLTQGAIADAAVTAGTTGSVNAHLRSISRDTMTTNTWASGTLGAMAAYGTTPGAVLVPGVNAFVTNSNANGSTTSANSSPVVVASDQAAIPVKNNGAQYETVAASQTAQVMGPTGATGDYLSHCVIYPVTTAAGAVTVFDNTNAAATNVITFTSGTLSNLAPIALPVGAISTAGAWKVTTGANVTVTCYGKFT